MVLVTKTSKSIEQQAVFDSHTYICIVGEHCLEVCDHDHPLSLIRYDQYYGAKKIGLHQQLLLGLFLRQVSCTC